MSPGMKRSQDSRRVFGVRGVDEDPGEEAPFCPHMSAAGCKDVVDKVFVSAFRDHSVTFHHGIKFT